MKKACLTIVLFALVTTPFSPGRALASRREWARAGRILTGYIALRTLMGDPLWPDHAYYPYARYGWRHRAWIEPYPSVFTRYPAPYGYVVYRPPPGEPPERWDSRPAAERSGIHPEAEREPLIVPLPDGRRLYQPGTAGSPSYVQVWSETEEEWVSVAEMPPLGLSP